MVVDRFPVIEAAIEPADRIETARVYFRSEQHPGLFYHVTMNREGGSFFGTLPMPSRETSGIVYYIEVVDRLYNSVRTSEFNPKVLSAGECAVRDHPMDNVPVIALAAVPPGFLAAGIHGASSAWAAVAIGAGVTSGAAAGVLVATGSDGNATTTIGPWSQQKATTTTSTVPREGATTTTTTSVPATSATTSVPPTTTTTVVPLAACFVFSDADPGSGCRVRFDASCSQGDIEYYHWWVADSPPAEWTETDPVTEYDWSSAPQCGVPNGFAKNVELTVEAADGSTDTFKQTIKIYYSRRNTDESALRSSFSSFLDIRPSAGEIHARVIVNDTEVHYTDNSAPFPHQFVGSGDRNTVEAHTISSTSGGGFWIFDFRGTEGFVPGSIQPELGQIVSHDSHSIAFHLNGPPGEQVKFSFRLLPRH